MEDEFGAAKRRVSARFLGRDNVHGVGAHPEAEATIAVYRAPDGGDAAALAEALRRAAAPFAVELIHEAAPEALDGADPAAAAVAPPCGDGDG